MQKSLKQQIKFERINVRDSNSIGNNASRSAATSRANWDAHVPSRVNIVPNCQKVFNKALPFDKRKFTLRSVDYFLCDFWIFFFKSVKHHFTQKLIVVLSIWRMILREKIYVFVNVFECKIAFISNFNGILYRFWVVRKKRCHLVPSFEIELISFKFESVWVVNCFLHLNAHQNILNNAIFLVYVMHVICCNRLHSVTPCNVNKHWINSFFFFKPVVLNFNIKVLAKHFFHAFNKLVRLIHLS